MSSTSLIVSKILPFSCVDGPGNRLVIFLQGCNYNCINCHNPHTITHCNDCGDCTAFCDSKALKKDASGKITFTEELCTSCDLCTDNCTQNANPKVQQYTTDSLVEIINKYRFFVNGITFSGGEATLQLKGLVNLISKIKADPALCHLSILIDSNGSLSASGWHKILPFIDGAMIDLKAWNSETHKKITGKGNERVIETINLLAKANKLQEVRLLLIPELSDYQEHIFELTNYLEKLPQSTVVKINAFRHHGVRQEAKKFKECSVVEYLSLEQKIKGAPQ